ADSDTLVARVESRKQDASDATAAVIRRQLDYQTGQIEWPILDASGSAEEVFEAAKLALDL
ncbi:MAG: AAA family ATPase, partial [Hyphomicrobiales bacterium]